jgi:hypothetical protein
MQLLRDRLGFIYTEKDYYKDTNNLDLTIFNLSSSQHLLRIEHNDFVASIPGFIALEELDLALLQIGLISKLTAPKNYSISRLISENLGEDLFKQVLGLHLINPTNKIETKTGGKVIKNVSGYDLNKIYIGSYNSLALINSVNLRLEKAPDHCAELKLSIPIDYSKVFLDQKLLNFLYHLCSLDFDDSLQIGLFMNLGLDSKSSLELRIRLSATEEILHIKTKQTLGLLIEFLKDNFTKLNLEKKIELEKKIFRKKYPKEETKIEFTTRFCDQLKLYNLLLQKSLMKNKFLIDLNRIRIVIRPKNSKIELYCPKAILESFLMEILNEDFDITYKLNLFPVTYHNKKLEFKYNKTVNSYEDKILKKLKESFDPKKLVNPGIFIKK